MVLEIGPNLLDVLQGIGAFITVLTVLWVVAAIMSGDDNI